MERTIGAPWTAAAVRGYAQRVSSRSSESTAPPANGLPGSTGLCWACAGAAAPAVAKISPARAATR